MFYETRIFNGVFQCRTTPNGEWRRAATAHADAVNALLALTDEGRLEVMRRFCVVCGKVQESEKQCQCWNDE